MSSHTNNTKCHYEHKCCFTLNLSFSSFSNLSLPPPFHHQCKTFIHMPTILDCIPVNQTSLMTNTLACGFPVLSCLLPFSHHCFSAQHRKMREALSLGALCLCNSRWHYIPTAQHWHFTASLECEALNKAVYC